MTARNLVDRIHALSEEQRREFRRGLGGFANENSSQLVAYIKTRAGHDLDSSQLRDSLDGRLPGYMIPSRYIEVSSLPRLANGKVDRKRLTQAVPVEPEIQQSEKQPPEYLASSTDDLESQIAAIWARNLNMDYVLPDDDFFELGGHSLLGVQLLLDIKEKFGVDISLADLFETPRLEDMVTRIRRPNSAARVVATIQAGKDLTPIFAVHGGDKTLAAAFGPERPVYLVFDSISTTSADMSSVEAIADYYLEGIREIQPRGPYIFCGWSIGGMVAYEMAIRLTKAGETVQLVGLFDSTPPHIGRWGLSMRIYHLFSRISHEEGIPNKAKFLFLTIPGKLVRRIRVVPKQSEPRRQTHDDILHANLARYFEIGFRYRYPVSELNCAVFMPEHHPLWVRHLLRKWRRIMFGPFSLECVRGAKDHADMTRPPYDAKSVESFAGRVSAVEATQSDAGDSQRLP